MKIANGMDFVNDERVVGKWGLSDILKILSRSQLTTYSEKRKEHFYDYR
jgi:hypothetical protein